MNFDRERDRQVRTAAFEWVASQVSAGGVVSRETIARAVLSTAGDACSWSDAKGS